MGVGMVEGRVCGCGYSGGRCVCVGVGIVKGGVCRCGYDGGRCVVVGYFAH